MIDIGAGDAYIIPANVPHSFIAFGDTQTDLDWEVKSAEPSDKRFFKRLMTWSEFKSYVEYLNEISYGGFNDWRVPSKHELRSLISYASINPAYQKNIFKTIVPNDYWCGAEPFEPKQDCAWVINFNVGFTTAKNQSLQSYGLAVRGKKLPPPQKKIHGQRRRHNYRQLFKTDVAKKKLTDVQVTRKF